MKIDFVSDVSCPWCAIGLTALETALQRIGPDLQAELHVQPFELNPQMVAEGEDVIEHLAAKYRLTPAQVAANTENIRQRGAAVGFTFGQGMRRRIYNTRDAHRLLHWAGLQDLDKQRALKHALFKAYFTDGLNPGDHGLLQDLAEGVGLDAEGAAAVLASDDFDAAVSEAEEFWYRNGISSVPAVIINEQHLISGGQPPEVFERALRQIAYETAAAPAAGAAGKTA